MITDDFLRMGWGSKTESPAWLVCPAPGGDATRRAVTAGRRPG